VFENMGSAFGDLKERLRKQRLVRLTRGNGSGWLTLDVCFCIDNTGSMTPYLSALTSQTDNVLHNLIQGIHAKLYKQFKAITIRIGALAYRDIGDREQFSTLPFQAPPAGKPNEDAKQQEETENKFMAQDEHRFIDWVANLDADGGADIPEDMFGALEQVAAGVDNEDESKRTGVKWNGRVRFCVVLTDAPAHGCEDNGLVSDHTMSPHAKEKYWKKVCKRLQDRRINLMFCSLNPKATAKTETVLQEVYDQAGSFKLTRGVPLFQTASATQFIHFVFVLDESGSMSGDWNDLVTAYQACISARLTVAQSGTPDQVSIVRFGTGASAFQTAIPIADALLDMPYASKRSTNYAAGFTRAGEALRETQQGYLPVLLFMTDGAPDGGKDGTQELNALRTEFPTMKTHVIGFRQAGNETLKTLARPGTPIQASNASQLQAEFAKVGAAANATEISDRFADRLSKEIENKISHEFL